MWGYKMTQQYTLTEVKAKFSEIISRVHSGKEEFMITRNGKTVAMLSPVAEIESNSYEEGLICAKGVLSKIDKEVDELVADVYANRTKAIDRKVDI
jgi:prevent-host-death family protein